MASLFKSGPETTFFHRREPWKIPTTGNDPTGEGSGGGDPVPPSEPEPPSYRFYLQGNSMYQPMVF